MPADKPAPPPDDGDVRELLRGEVLRNAIEQWNDLSGGKNLRFSGDSMEPTLRDGDELLACFAPFTPAVGQIVVIIAGSRLIVHRIIALEEQSGQAAVVEMGDNGLTPGRFPADQAVGLVQGVKRRGLWRDVATNDAATMNRLVIRIQGIVLGIRRAIPAIPGRDAVLCRGRRIVLRLLGWYYLPPNRRDRITQG